MAPKIRSTGVTTESESLDPNHPVLATTCGALEIWRLGFCARLCAAASTLIIQRTTGRYVSDIFVGHLRLTVHSFETHTTQRQSFSPLRSSASTSTTGVFDWIRITPCRALVQLYTIVSTAACTQTLESSSPYITFHIAFKNSPFQRPQASNNIHIFDHPMLRTR